MEKEALEILVGKTFGPDEIVVFDGYRFEGCIFDHCCIVVTGLIGWSFDGHCEFLGPRWDFTGPAFVTVELLRFLWQTGASGLIEVMLGQKSGSSTRDAPN